MQLLIPYKSTDIHISTTYTGDLELTLPNDLSLHQKLLNQLFDALSAQEFINTIGTQQFEQLIEFYNNPDFEE